MIKNIEVFETDPIPKAVFKLALPTVLSMIVTVFYNMVDTFFVGQIGDPNQVAAVSVATPVFLFLMAAGNIFGVGGSSFLSRALGEKKVDKTYWAVVKNKPPEDTGSLIHFLKKDEAKNKSKAYDHEVKNSQRSWLDYKLLGKSDNYYLLEVNPHTGRHHQIRVQLASMGCPIKGDVKYGFDRTNEDGSIHLHARSIQFMHPVKGEEIKLTAPVPDEVIWNFFDKNLPSES